MPRVSVVVVTYNARPYLPDLFESLDRQTFRDFETVVVDNDSKDGTVPWLRERPVVLLPQSRNTGFARGCNLGMDAARGELLFLLNQDTTLDPECIAELVRAMEAHPRAAVCGAKMFFWHEPSILNSFGLEATRFLYFWDRGIFEPDEGQYDNRPVLAVSGGAMMVRAGRLRFDEAYFMYQEDVDLCLRAIRSGWDVITAPRAKVYHKQTFEGHSPAHRSFRNPRNRLRTILKNVAWPELPFVLAGHVGYEMLVSAVSCLRRDWTMALGRLRALFQKPPPRNGPRVPLVPRTGPHWRPSPLLRPPDYRPLWEARLDDVALPESIRVGDPEPALGYGWSPARRMDGRIVRTVPRYGIAWLGPGGPRLVIHARARTRTQVQVNGKVAGEIEPGKWTTTVLAASSPSRARIVLRGDVTVESIGWTS